MKTSEVLAAMGVAPKFADAHYLRSASGRDAAKRKSTRFLAEWRRIAEPRRGAGGMIYLDYQATTPVAPEVAEAMQPWIEDKFANPHSPSRWGREAAAAIEVARKQVEKAIGLKGGSVAFTGSATEALNWALKGTVEKAPSGRNRIITVATEHAAVLDTCEWLAGQGHRRHRASGRAATGCSTSTCSPRELDERVLLVAVMLVNNEIGVIQPLAEIADLAHEAGALMLCDAVQALRPGRTVPMPDLVAISAHKIHGPKGIGALWMREGAEPAPLIHGGGQEQGLRSGTLSPALCVGFGAAAKLADERCTRDHDHVEKLWNGRDPGARAGLDDQRQHRPPLSRQSQHSPRGGRCGTADRRPARHCLFARIGLRQRIGAAEPRAARAGPRRSRGALLDPAWFRPLYEPA